MDLFAYMRPYLKVRALGSALELGVIDRLFEAEESLAIDRICSELRLHGRGCALLLQLLAAHGVVALSGQRAGLTRAFREDYATNGADIRVITDYLNLAYQDLQHLSSMAKNGEATGSIHEFWRYGRDEGTSGKHGMLLQAATRLQGGLIVESLRLRGNESVLDLGGNNGEFALQICRKYPELRCEVFDLEAACRLGESRRDASPEFSRIDFHPGDFLRDELPGRPEVIIAKSVLHDWQGPEARSILGKAYRSLPDNGRILIVEHMTDGEPDRDALLFDLVFMYLIGPEGSFRSSGQYEQMLRETGFAEVTCRKTGFLGFRVVEGRKPRR